MHTITIRTEQMNTAINEITSVAEKTASGTQNVSAAAEEQLATMEEIAASSNSLSLLAAELQAAVSNFKI